MVSKLSLKIIRQRTFKKLRETHWQSWQANKRRASSSGKNIANPNKTMPNTILNNEYDEVAHNYKLIWMKTIHAHLNIYVIENDTNYTTYKTTYFAWCPATPASDEGFPDPQPKRACPIVWTQAAGKAAALERKNTVGQRVRGQDSWAEMPANNTNNNDKLFSNTPLPSQAGFKHDLMRPMPLPQNANTLQTQMRITRVLPDTNH